MSKKRKKEEKEQEKLPIEQLEENDPEQIQKLIKQFKDKKKVAREVIKIRFMEKRGKNGFNTEKTN